MERFNFDLNKSKSPAQCFRLAASAAVVVTFVCAAISGVALAQQKSFSSAEQAVEATVAAAKNNEEKELLAIFGAQAKELLFSGDAVADRERRAEFVAA